MNYSYTNADGRRSLVIVLDTGNAHTIPGSHPKFTELLHYLGNTADPDNQHVRRLIDFGADAADTLQRLSDRVTYRQGTIRFDGEVIDTALTRHLVRMIRDGDDRYTGLVRFMENLAANPSRKSRHIPSCIAHAGGSTSPPIVPAAQPHPLDKANTLRTTRRNEEADRSDRSCQWAKNTSLTALVHRIGAVMHPFS